MAAGFKKATVRSGDVPATQTNFPSYVDLDRLGITTLAEAQSVRVYADSGKTTEWAREIVSVTEMHVKVPSLTSTVEIFVDWDGVRSDYGVTTTYGRNNVWSDYVAVYHLDEDVNNTTDGYADSTGTNPGTGVSMSESSVSGKLNGKSASFNGSNDYIAAANSTSLNAPNTNNAVTISTWLKSDSVSQGTFYALAKASDQYAFIFDFVANTYEFWGDSAGARFNIGTSTDVTNWLYLSASFNGATDAALANFNGTSNSYTRTGSLAATNTGEFLMGATKSGAGLNTPTQFFGGSLDEVRVRSDAVSAAWMTTEYNNQNAESTFWGTWTDAGGGGGGGAAQAARRGAVMMM